MFKDPARKNEYSRLWIASRRAAFFADKVCARCGSSERLQLHHRNKDTKVHSEVWSWSPTRAATEIAKCDILCDPCHRKHHAEERRARIQHGTYAGYDTLMCRCEKCRRASSEYRQQLRQREAHAAAR